MPYPPQGFIDQSSREDINGLKRDAKRWKIIGIAFFLVGIGVGWILNMFL
ncbi:hypothetical protein ES704_01445 [subsurface metagenome]